MASCFMPSTEVSCVDSEPFRAVTDALALTPLARTRVALKMAFCDR